MMQNNRNILPMDQCHVAQVAELERRCFPDPWSERSIAGELENPLSLWLVAVEGDRVIGYVGSQSVLDEADLLNVAVAPEARRQGLARALLLALEDCLRQRKVCSLTLEVRDSNAPAISLYLELGYEQVGLRRGYYLQPREDARILKKEWRL